MPRILAFAEAREGTIRPVAREAVAAARALAAAGDEVEAVVLGGAGVGGEAAGLGSVGASRVHVGESDALKAYSPEAYTTVLAGLVRSGDYRAVVFPGSAMGKDLAPRLAARLGAGYASDCTGLELEGEEVVATRPRYAGKVFARERITGSPAVVTVRGNAFAVEEGSGSAEVVPLDLSLREADFGAIVCEVRSGAAAKLDVAEAPIVVSGGRGLRDPANFKLLEELAEVLGNAAVGASRAVVDAGWRPHSDQVGQTGKTVAPQLYFAIGISGAIQHLAGMRTAKYIVAINKDPDAPIFKVADYGIVGDLFEIVPRLTEEIRRLRSS
ncbi:MAG TPA: electron transfer flavoprotein subunit alpha/FixB family protein [Longimicrobiaceae bacterium]